MTLIQRLSIRIKLLLLAGVPVVGALVLAVLIASDARDRAASAAALGSVEDLARLSAQMNGALRAMQSERAIAALREGLAAGEGAETAQWELDKQTLLTDAARAELELFFRGRDLATLPTRLAQSLGEARTQMAELPAFRIKLATGTVPVDEVLAIYGRIDKRVQTDITRLAERLGKAKPKVVVESNGVRLPAKRFGAFWASMVHVVRNAMDHGIESPEERKAAGKPEMGAINLRSTETPDHIIIECSDDGAGIDWHAVAFKAGAAGLPSTTSADLQSALFASGVSTAKAVTDVSGRGVGLAAVHERCTTLDGTVAVTSTRGAGTRVVFSFPRHASGRSNSHLPVSHQRAC